MTKCDHDHEGAIDLARQILVAGIEGHLDDIPPLLTRLADTGPCGFGAAMCAWADTLLGHSGGRPEPGQPVSLSFVHADTGADGIDSVPREIRWAGQILAARAADDRDTWNALMAAISDGQEAGDHVAAFLEFVIINVRAALHSTPEGTP